jgi:hypothetical protein
MSSFGSSKKDLSLKYRLGLEYALAKADFLNSPDITLVQAFSIFLCLVRRYDSPRFVWMLTGLVIRMAQYLGLQRDGANFNHLTPFEIEMRRRVWWGVCMLDLRSSEDQGTDLTIASGSFDTKMPLNINDADISPESKQMPTEREGITDMTMARISIGLYDIVKQLMAPSDKDAAASLEEQNYRLNAIYETYEKGYLQYATEPGNILYWVTVTITRLVMAKMTLISFLPVLFSSPSEQFSDKIRNKLLVAALELAEYNHALNAEHACRHWRWIYQTYTHWHAIVYLLIDIARRPWSPIVERSWIALHSKWLIPDQGSIDKKLRIWVPLRRLMAKVSAHRDAELRRLRADAQAATQLEIADQRIPLPSSPAILPPGMNVDFIKKAWRQLVGLPEASGDGTRATDVYHAGLADLSLQSIPTNQALEIASSEEGRNHLKPNSASQSTYNETMGQQTTEFQDNTNFNNRYQATTHDMTNEFTPSPAALVASDWSNNYAFGYGSVPWLWADVDSAASIVPDMDSMDVNMDMGSEVDWYNLVQSTTGIEANAGYGT